MNHKPILVAVLIVLALTLTVVVVSAQGPQPREPRAPSAILGYRFTYQGQLKNNGAPVNGTCDFQFGLWDASTFGTQVGTTQTVTTTITNGLFTVQLDFGASSFNGDARWLQSTARCPAGSGGFTAFTPRQQLTAAPYALFSAAPWATSGGNISYNGGNVGIGTSNPTRAPLETAGATGNTVALFGGDGTGVALIRNYPFIGFNSYYNGGWKAIAPGYGGHLGIEGDVGAMTFYVNGNASSANATVSPTETMRISQSGNVGIGTTTPCSGVKLHVYTGNSGWLCGSAAVRGESSSEVGVNGVTSSLIGVYGLGDSGDGVSGLSNSGVGVRAASNGGTGLFARSLTGTYIFEGWDSNANVRRFAVERATGNIVASGKVIASGGFNGTCRTDGVVAGGPVCNQDFAEAFQSIERTQPGDLVALVPNANGAPTVRKSTPAYDELLIGVVSQNPGLVFDNGETHIAGDNSQLITNDKTVVALVGRVNVKVSIQNGVINIGDPLTSSTQPGVAMKATRAGKIIGYAMESANANGVVLALVQLGDYIPPAQLDAFKQNAQLEARVDALESRVKDLETQNATLRAQAQELEQQNASLEARVAALEQTMVGRVEGGAIPLKWVWLGGLAVVGLIAAWRQK